MSYFSCYVPSVGNRDSLWGAVYSLPLWLIAHLFITSCTHVNKSHIETLKYLISKDISLYLALESTSRNKVFDVINLPYFVRYWCLSVIAMMTLSYKENWENATWIWRWLIYSNTFKHLFLSLIDVIGNVILIRSHLMHSLKGLTGYDWHNWILSIRLVFIEPITSAAVQCLCKPLMMCYLPW